MPAQEQGLRKDKYMFNYIKGTFVSSGDGFVVIENGGIGYTVYTSLNTIGKISGKENAKLYTYLYLREGIMDLYGFATEEEKTMFLNLISISGVGPKAAVSILSVAAPEKIALAILTADYKLIQKAQGVGVKVAQRVVMELKDKLKNTVDVSAVSEQSAEVVLGGSVDEAFGALLVLGYSETEAKKALSGADASETTEEIIKSALKALL